MKYKTVHSRGKKWVITRVVNLGGRPYVVTEIQAASPANVLIRVAQHSNVILIFAIGANVEIDSQAVYANHYQRITSLKRELHVSVPTPGACLILQLPLRLDEYRSLSQTAESGYYTPRCTYWIERMRIFIHKHLENAVELSTGIRQLLNAITTEQVAPSGFSHLDLAQLLQFELHHSQSDKYTGTIFNVSRSLGIKTYRLKLLLREVYDCTAHNWLLAGKMSNALKLLQNKQLTLQYIATQTGYRLEENFIIAFRNYYGITPHAFRTRVHHLPLPSFGNSPDSCRHSL